MQHWSMPHACVRRVHEHTSIWFACDDYMNIIWSGGSSFHSITKFDIILVICRVSRPLNCDPPSADLNDPAQILFFQHFIIRLVRHAVRHALSVVAIKLVGSIKLWRMMHLLLRQFVPVEISMLRGYLVH